MNRIIFISFLSVFIIFTTGGVAMSMELKSSVFSNEGNIPSKYTCDGADVSPPLQWSGAPEGTKSFALISDDPDAPKGTWVHWVVWNIPAERTMFEENQPKTVTLADGTHQGITDFKRPGYGGPCPPSGVHRYYFKLYALDAELKLPDDSNKAKLEAAMKGHVLAEARYMGTYSRK